MFSFTSFYPKAPKKAAFLLAQLLFDILETVWIRSDFFIFEKVEQPVYDLRGL